MELIRKRSAITMALAFLTVFVVGASILQPVEASAAAKPGKVKSLNLTAKSNSSIAIKFTSVSGAAGYQIYQASSKSGTYKKVKTLKGVKSVTYTRTGLKAGTRYYFKVRAYKTTGRKNVYGAFSSVKSAKTKAAAVKPAKPENLKLLAGKTSITINFQQVSGASGYQIYRSEVFDGSYKYLTTLKGKSSTTYKDTGLKPVKKYFYKVRAYKQVKGKNVYGAFCYPRSKITKGTKPEISKVGDFTQLQKELIYYRDYFKSHLLESSNTPGYAYEDERGVVDVDGPVYLGGTDLPGVEITVVKGDPWKYLETHFDDGLGKDVYTAISDECDIYYTGLTQIEAIDEDGWVGLTFVEDMLKPLTRPTRENGTKLEKGETIRSASYDSKEELAKGKVGDYLSHGRSRQLEDLYIAGYKDGACVFLVVDTFEPDEGSFSWI